MTAEERARMRAALHAAVAHARLPGAELRHPGAFSRPSVAPADLVDRFRRELTALGGTVHEPTDAAGVAAIVRDLAGPGANAKVLMWDEAELPVKGIADALAAVGLTLLTQSPDTARSGEHRRLLASAAVGLTGAAAGLAETGSVVVSSGPGRGRLASLLPPVHVALVRTDAIVSSLPELLNARPDLVTAGANFVCITGPSRTADIEHVLARGVHGPKDVHVILVERPTKPVTHALVTFERR
jgi:L-lactate utilization protein LutC